MQRKQRSLGAVLLVVASAITIFCGHVGAAEPGIGLEGSTHVITFTSPPVYDVSANHSSSYGDIDSVTLIDQDQKGKIEGVLVDKGDSVTLTTNIAGTIKRAAGVTVIKLKEKGTGDLGNGDYLASRGVKRSVISQTPGGTTAHSELTIKTCAYFKLPAPSTKYSKVCNSNSITHDGPFGHSGDWVVRLDLEQSPSGELFGFGKIITNVHSAQFKRETDVIIDGLAKDEGLAKIKLSPLFKGGDGPVTMVAQLNGTQYPAVLFVLSVKGKLLGQKFSEVFHEEIE